jgi:hypothetical protein
MTPGAEITITRTLAPGTYVFIDGVPDTHGVPFTKRRGWKPFRVVGDSGAALPPADAVVVAEKKHFPIPPLRAGVRTIELRNRAGAGRGFMLATLDPGRTRAEAERWFAQIEKTGRHRRALRPSRC